MKIFRSITFLIVLLSSFNSYANFSEKKEVKLFINEMVQKHNFDKKYLTNLFSKYDTSQEIINKISKPYEALTWDRYQKLLVTDKRVKGGVEFWQKHKDTLAKVEKQYGVPAETIIAIIGIETSFGRVKGSYPLIESLSTLAFNYKPRAKFFKQELEEFLLLTKEKNFNPIEMKGSYAGAMGIPQFISSSYRNYAVGFKNKNSPDIINNVDSAIASVANYFKKHGWKDNQKIAHKVKVYGTNYKKIVTKKIADPKHSLDRILSHNVTVKDKVNKNNKFSLIELKLKDGSEKWLAEHNFFVITRYNRSYNYAMAVFKLSQKIKHAYENQA